MSPDCNKFDLGLRRGSAPSDLLRNTGASIASCWIQFRDRIKVKVYTSKLLFSIDHLYLEVRNQLLFPITPILIMVSFIFVHYLKGKEIALSAGTGLMGDNGCGFAVRECRRRSLRRRRSGGPELFASVVRRSNNFSSAQLPPLPQSASTTCTHAKLKVFTLVHTSILLPIPDNWPSTQPTFN